MRPHLALALLVLVSAPLAALGWLGVRLEAQEAEAEQRRFDGWIGARLDEIAGSVQRVLAGIEGELLAATEDLPSAGLRSRLRDERRLSHLLVFDGDGRLSFPPPEGPMSADERALLERTRGLWESRDFARRGQRGEGDDGAPGAGWSIWYWGDGLNLMYRRGLPDGRTVAVELDRPRLLSAVISALPSTPAIALNGEHAERLSLRDSSGRIIYQWGTWEPPAGIAPRLERPLPAPLEAWHLTWSGPPPPRLSRHLHVVSLGAAALVLVALALWFYRASTAELRRAARRVSFVNQVSHELKTPLTNIRMYAELLDDALWDADDRTRRHLGVIVDESQRLSRLIANILTFARDQRERLTLRPSPARLDALVAGVVEQFAPALGAKGIAVEADLDADAEAELDADAVGQILGNLLGNVEKYAADGGRVEVITRQRGDEVSLTVADAGPGIDRAHRAKVFDPFYRISDALSDGVTGTGIGLGIARTLARLHGGDLVLEPSERGARFTARLRAPRVERSGGEREEA